MKMPRAGLIQSIITVLFLFGITTTLYLYTSGYRVEKEIGKQIDIKKTGMISVKSIPNGATVLLNDKPVTATDSTIPGLEKGVHRLRVEKRGFVPWEKEVEVFEEMVTDITAILVSQSPRLEPLTNTGASYPSISPSLTKLAYFSNDDDKPGIWIIPLSYGGLNIFRSNPTVAIQDTRFTKYSFGHSITWAPDEKYLLIESHTGVYYLVDISTGTAETTTTPDLIRKEWSEKLLKKRTDFLEKIELPPGIKELASSDKVIWAPDEKKFLYIAQVGEELEYRVYNLEDPLPVGEKTESTVFKIGKNDSQPTINWYSDSFHLILVDGNISEDRRGTISIIRIDGTNKTELYNNTLHFDSVFSAPSGDKVIILTTFKSGDQTDLYTLSIR